MFKLSKLLVLLFACLISVSALADTLSSGWDFSVACYPYGTTGSGSFEFSCPTLDGSSGTCGRTSTEFTQLSLGSSYTGTGNPQSTTVYAVQTGDVLIVPPILSTEYEPIFSVSTAALTTGTYQANWINVQWDTGTATLTDNYLIGTASVNPATGAGGNGVVLTGQWDINGSVYWSSTVNMPGTWGSGDSAGVYTASGGGGDLEGTAYFTAAGAGAFKTSPGRATFFFPQQNLVLSTIGSTTFAGIMYDANSSDAVKNMQVVSNSAGTSFTSRPYSNPSTGTIDSSFTDTISFTSTNTPANGMFLGTVTRTGTGAGTGNIACIANTVDNIRVICSGQSPSNNSIPFTLSFSFTPVPYFSGSPVIGTVTGSSIQITWDSGGGDPNGYQIVYNTGSTPPSDCSTGTVISSSQIGSATSYVVSGLNGGTEYSFQICAIDNAGNPDPANSEIVSATTESASQYLFVTQNAYTGNMESVYWADFDCQQEAISNGLSGTWKALLSTSTSVANSRINITGPVYNLYSGGSQELVTGEIGFWSGSLSAYPNFYANGNYAYQGIWTGSNNDGSLSSNGNCTDWTSTSGNAEYGNSNTTSNWLAWGAPGCGSSLHLYCVNGQSSSGTPNDPSNLTYLYADTSMNFSWNTGGGTTAGYKIAYQTGATAPSDCSSGTVVTSTTIGHNTSYIVTGLTAGTQYSFRLCAVNSDSSAASAGITTTLTTNSESQVQHLFVTQGAYTGNMQSVYWADYACQQEAINNSLTGTWRALLSTTGAAANSRISTTYAIYNTNGSGNQLLAFSGSDLWTGNARANPNFYANGSYAYQGIWTGSNNDGSLSSNGNCSDWTTTSGNAEYGNSNTPTNWLTWGTPGCGASLHLYCVSGQASSGTPTPPSSLSDTLSDTSINFSWNAGGGTTAGYQIAYQAGATPPANCNSGTVISSASIGHNTSYIVTGLTAGTQYSFIVCSVNSDSTLDSTGITATLTTNSSSQIQHMFVTANAYTGNMESVYWADFYCQQDAINNGYTGTWKALVSTTSTNANSRITTNYATYNTYGSGNQLLAYSGSDMWSGNLRNSPNYYANGSYAYQSLWTGSNSDGSLSSNGNCSDWTTTSGSGQYGNSNSSSASWISNGTPGCGSSMHLYCVSGQASSGTPNNPSNLTYTYADTSMNFSWTNGGGTTAGYVIAYQTGATAPSNCASGTVVASSTIGHSNQYIVTGLTAGTQYSFRLCAVNSDSTAASTGITATLTTNSSTQIQHMFVTASGYTGNMESVYWADFYCQQDALNNGYTGTWKALLSTSTANANSRITTNYATYNTYGSGNQLLAYSGSDMWSGNLRNSPNFYANGNAAYAGVWTGSNSDGSLSSNGDCTDWTTTSGGAQYGASLTSTSGWISNGTPNCNNGSMHLYCVSGQASSGTPNNPSNLTYTYADTSMNFSWTNGGGTTAGYVIAYQTGATAPSNCASGTVVASSTIGHSNQYIVTGLTAGTQYSFRLCAVNSDSTAASTGITATLTTNSSTQIQHMFVTASGYTGNMESVYWADFYCQQDALNNGYTGTWKALLSTSTANANSRITTNYATYNTYGSGNQLLAYSGSDMWSGNLRNSPNFYANGNAAYAGVWTGSNSDGSLSSNGDCTDWTTTSGGAQYGASLTSTSGWISNGTPNCNNGSMHLYCVSGQASSGTPNNPSNLTYTYADTSMNFSWTNGGGTTAGYVIAYQAGDTAPSNCASGTVISSSTIGHNTAYILTGLTAGVQYSFRLCAVNSDSTAASTGITATLTTESESQLEHLFVTANGYNGDLGGQSGADSICMTEASTASLSGTWKAVLSTTSVNAQSYISTSYAIYNMNNQLLAYSGNDMWSGNLRANPNYYPNGSAAYAGVWTGSNSNGTLSSNGNCSDWSTTSGGGQYGASSTSGSGWLSNGTPNCNNGSLHLYCISGQSSSASLNDPSNLSSTPSDFGVTLNWTSGGGSTAAFQIAYQTGATPPSDCNSGTVISYSTIGSASSYPISGLTSQTYAVRLCAVTSGDTSMSSGITTVFTPNPVEYIFVTSGTYTGNLGGLSGADTICNTEAASAGLSGTWKAILSTSSTNANTGVGGDNGQGVTISYDVYDTLNNLIANGPLTFWDGTHSAPISYHADGSGLGGSTSVWTGSGNNGGDWAYPDCGYSSCDCNGWTSNSASIVGQTGSSGSESSDWINQSSSACNTSQPLYCVSVYTPPTAASACSSSGSICTIIGNTSLKNTSSGDGGAATSAGLNVPWGIAVNTSGDVYFTEHTTLRMVPAASGTYFGQAMTGGNIYTIAGGGSSFGNNILATTAELSAPYQVALDTAGNVYFNDWGLGTVRMIPATSGTYFGQTMTANYIYTIAGSGGGEYTNALGALATTQPLEPDNVTLDSSGNVYIADDFGFVYMVPASSGTYYGQSMTAAHIYVIAGSYDLDGAYSNSVQATSANLDNALVALDPLGNLFISSGFSVVQMVPVNSGTNFGISMTSEYLYTIIGAESETGGYSGDGGAATSALINNPWINMDSSGNLFIGDSDNQVIRMVPASSGTYYGQSMTAHDIYTIAGNYASGIGYSGDGGAATSAQLNYPRFTAKDGAGNLYIVDAADGVIRMVKH